MENYLDLISVIITFSGFVTTIVVIMKNTKKNDYNDIIQIFTDLDKYKNDIRSSDKKVDSINEMLYKLDFYALMARNGYINKHIMQDLFSDYILLFANENLITNDYPELMRLKKKLKL